MSSRPYRGVMRGGMVVFPEGAQTPPEGTEVLVTPLTTEAGTPAAVLAAMAAGPPVPRDWVDELEELIASGTRPPLREDLFGNAAGDPEAS